MKISYDAEMKAQIGLEPIRKPVIEMTRDGASSCHSRMPLAGIHRCIN